MCSDLQLAVDVVYLHTEGGGWNYLDNPPSKICADPVTIFDGPDINSAVLFEFCDHNHPQVAEPGFALGLDPMVAVSTGSSITVRFQTNAQETRNGFIADIYNIGKTSLIIHHSKSCIPVFIGCSMVNYYYYNFVLLVII